jgi:hypothetical protein
VLALLGKFALDARRSVAALECDEELLDARSERCVASRVLGFLLADPLAAVLF